MADDIVARLRDGLFYEVWDDEGMHWKSDITNKAIWEAIKEIERLRADLEEMRQVVISEHRRWCDRPCNAEEWNLHE